METLTSAGTACFYEETSAMSRVDVLIVDDDRSWAESVVELLRDSGFTTKIAGDAEEALDLIEKQAPGLIVSDVHMPRISGLELLRQVRRGGRQTPVLMMSADDQASIQNRAMLEGATAFLRKPVAGAMLLRAVKRLLGAHAAMENDHR